MKGLKQRTFTQWNMAEFANISPHYTFCVHHKPYTALLDTSFLDFMQLFFPTCSRLLIVRLEGPVLEPRVLLPSLDVEHHLK
jgi:hypothetical protein